MRVGVNLAWLRPGEVGGSEEYLTRLLEAVDTTRPGEVDLTLFALAGFAAAHPGLAAAHRVVTAPVSGRRRSLRVGAEATWLPRAARRSGVDLVHHGGGTAVSATPPALLHVHDLQYLVRPETFSPVKLAFLRRAVPRSVARSRLVACPSEYVRSTVVDGLGASPADVVVVPHVLGGPGPEAEAEGVRRAFGLDRPWFVYPAITYPHKNHVVLVRALAAVPDALLVLPGGQGRAEAAVTAEVGRLGLAERVRRVGRVPGPDLRAMVGGAVATLFPSTHEGFGAPVLEAMAAGCPVVVAAATALPEVVGGAGLLVDPHDEGAWADAMNRLLADQDERDRLAAAGRARAAAFAPAAGAEALLDAYRRVAAGS
jgi:alpha-1,3-rhamnosyl/mannosyltransferase